MDNINPSFHNCLNIINADLAERKSRFDDFELKESKQPEEILDSIDFITYNNKGPVISNHQIQAMLSTTSPEPAREASKNDEPAEIRSGKNENTASSDEIKRESEMTTDGDLTKITVIHTNDIHGITDKIPMLTEVITDLRKADPKSIIVDSGDIAYSSKPVDDPYSYMVDFLNYNGYTAIVPGNHDFQWGKDESISNFFKKLDADVLCANAMDKESEKPLESTKPYVIKDVNGVKVGIIGITTSKMTSPDHPDTGDDLILFDEKATLQADVAMAKEAGADIVIALMHKGITDVKELRGIAQLIPDLDLIVIGHDHKIQKTSFRTGEFPHRTYIVEAGSYGNYVGKVDLFIDNKTKKVIEAKMKTFPVEKYITKMEKEDMNLQPDNKKTGAS